MPKPKDIGTKGERPPVLKFGASSGYSGIATFAIVAGIIAALYIAGVVLHNAIFIGAAIVLATAGIICFILIRRSSSKVIDKEKIDAEVERYRQDLVDTYVGYDVDFDADDLEDAVARYREELEYNAASALAANPVDIARELIKRDKDDG